MKELVDYLTDGYWEEQGLGRRKFNVVPGGTLTANVTALTQRAANWPSGRWMPGPW